MGTMFSNKCRKSTDTNDSDEENQVRRDPLRLYREQHIFSTIEDDLHLGEFSGAVDQTVIENLNIGRVLSVCEQTFSFERFNGVLYKRIAAHDAECQDLLTHFEECIQFISDGQSSGQNVYVHCMAGISRSPTIVIAYLMSKYKLSYQIAYELVKSKRPFIYPNNGFVMQLKLYETMNFKVNINSDEYKNYFKHIREAKAQIEAKYESLYKGLRMA